MRRPAPHSLGVNLFPFLAVLICTMGVMLLLLVFINRPGGAADQIADEEAASGHSDGGSSAGTTAAGNAAASDQQTAGEMLKWKLSQLEISRQKTEDDLADRRLRLSSVEDNIRALGDQWKQLQQAGRDLEAAGDTKRTTSKPSPGKSTSSKQLWKQQSGRSRPRSKGPAQRGPRLPSFPTTATTARSAAPSISNVARTGSYCNPKESR